MKYIKELLGHPPQTGRRVFIQYDQSLEEAVSSLPVKRGDFWIYEDGRQDHNYIAASFTMTSLHDGSLMVEVEYLPATPALLYLMKANSARSTDLRTYGTHMSVDRQEMYHADFKGGLVIDPKKMAELCEKFPAMLWQFNEKLRSQGFSAFESLKLTEALLHSILQKPGQAAG